MALTGYACFLTTVIVLFSQSFQLNIVVMNTENKDPMYLKSNVTMMGGQLHRIKLINDTVFKTIARVSTDLRDADVIIIVNPMNTPPIEATEANNYWMLSRLDTSKSSKTHIEYLHIVYICKLVQRMQWPFTFILADTKYEHYADLLAKCLSEVGVKINTIIIRGDSYPLGFLLEMVREQGTLHVQPNLRFIVIATLATTVHLLEQIEQFDAVHGQGSLLRHFSRWKLFLDNGALEAIEAMDLKLDHVSVVLKPRTIVDMGNIVKVVEKLALAVLEKTNITNNTDSVNTFIQMVNSKTKVKVPTLHTLLWKENGRRFSKIRLKDDAEYSQQIFPNSLLGLNGRRLTGSVLEWVPFTKRHENNGVITYTHATIDMVDLLAETINFTYLVKEPADNEWGRPHPDNPEIYTGILGMVQTGEAELSLCPLGVTQERDKVVDYLSPIYHAYQGILLGNSRPGIQISTALTDPFKWEVYAYGGGALIFVTVLYLVLERYNPFYLNNDKKKRRNVPNVADCILFFFGAIIHQGSHNLPQSWTGRTIVTVWWLFAIIMTAAYSGNLIASLTVNEDKMPYSTVEDVINAEDLKLGLWAGTVIHTELMSSNHSEMKRLWKKIDASSKVDPSVLTVNFQELLKKVAVDNYGYVSDITELESYTLTMCNTYVLEEHFLPKGYSLIFRNGSPLTEVFSKEVLKIQESGLLQQWMRKWSPPKGNGDCEVAPSGVQPIRLEKLAAVAFILSAGILSATLCLIVEIFVKSSCMTS